MISNTKISKLNLCFKKIYSEPQITILFLIVLAVFVYSLYLNISYSSQIPLDKHAFRQTQTALTAYWLIKTGFQLAYETPVLGIQWSIPFEFPIYQTVVAFLSGGFNLDINSTGRIVSYIFMLLTLAPVFMITKKLKLSNITFFYFIALFFSMPTYIYWGRSFMIETAAIFFGITAIKFFIDYLLGERSFWVLFAFLVFSSLCLLQKATTGIPILTVLFISFIIFEFKKIKSISTTLVIQNIFVAGIIFLIPLTIIFIWTEFTDLVKMKNAVGDQITSSALFEWNWGSLSQRISGQIWGVLLWDRIFNLNLGALLGVFLLLAPFIIKVEIKVKAILAILISLALLPLLMFINLHYEHDYYQTANLIFLAYAISIILSLIVTPILGMRVSIFILILLIISNYIALNKEYLPLIKTKFTNENRNLAVGKILNRELSTDMQFIAFGNDWSPTFAYISERKSFTVPSWFKRYDEAIKNPAQFLDHDRFGGIVSCTNQSPNFLQLYDLANKNGFSKVGISHGCFIAVPEKKFFKNSLKLTQCQGDIDRITGEVIDDKMFINVLGWLSRDIAVDKVPQNAFLKVTGNQVVTIFEMLRVPRLDINQRLKMNYDDDVGFSRIIENKFKPGVYQFELIYDDSNGFRSCGIAKNIEIR